MWDYSGRWGNLNGRVCLRNSLLFGILSVGVVLWIHPAIVTFLRILPPYLVYVFFLSLMAYLLFDLTVTVRALLDVNREAGIRSLQLGQVSATRDTYKKGLRQKAARRFLRSRNRLFRAFPRMRSIRYPDFTGRNPNFVPAYADQGNSCSRWRRRDRRCLFDSPGRRKTLCNCQGAAL